MADEVLGPTLLCEAMEYLSKLAKNLGLRTETMKEKRINKTKLKNMRSVKTAAEKVLLLCDLSKKSIENVENSVKGLIQESSAYSGGKFEKSSSSTTTKINNKNRLPNKRIVISGKKYDIKIPRNISLKHYMSVNVMAKSMPLSMLNKYPVYKHCKLYYSRKNRDKKRESITSSKDSSSKQELKEKENSNEFDPHRKSDICKTVSSAKNKNEVGTDDLSDTENVDRYYSKTEARKDSIDRGIDKTVILEQEDVSVTNKNIDRLEQEDGNVANKNIDRLSPVEASEIQHSGDEISPNRHSLKKRRKKNVIDDSDTESNSEFRNSPKKLVETSEIQLSSDEINPNRHSMKKGKKKNDCDNSDSDSNPKGKDLPKKQVETGEIQHGSDEISPSEDYVKKRKKKNVSDDFDNDCNSKHRDSSKKLVETNEIQHSSDKISPNQHFIKKAKKKIFSDESDTENNSKHRDSAKKHRTSLDNDKTSHGHKSVKKRTSMTLLSDSDDENKIALNEVEPMESNVIELDSDQEEKTTNNETKVHSDDINEKSNADQSETNKPLIKCVNISKLLKPDVAIKYDSKQDSKSMNQKNIVVMTKRGEIMSKPHSHSKASKKVGYESMKTNDSMNISLKGDIINQEYEDFWAPKRREVKRFVPKKLSITVEKLPLCFTTDFLLKSNLVRITQNSAIICEVLLEKDIQSENSTELHKEEIILELVQAKNVLLNDSDEDAVQQQSSIAENEQVKKTLLDESDSESNGNEKEITAVEALEEQSKSGRRSGSPSTAVDKPKICPEKEIQSKDSAKTALLDESSGSKSDDSLNKTHSNKNSRRKNIMESMHAKKMLLTYSSSSETEDEQLKNVLKEIKESLMKDIASDEEKAKHDVRIKMLSTSDSEEEEITLNNKKRRKLNESEETLKKDVNISRKSSSESPNPTNPDKMGRSSENPDESSSHNTDQRDDKEIERLVELSSLNKPRQARGETALSAKSRSNMSRTPLIKGQAGLLEVDLPSDDDASASANDTDNAEEEDLPTVELSGLNGGSPLEHLAKDDLLGESESDSSKDKSSDNIKKEDDSEIENIKLKRRKPNAISSDSEAGSSRKPKEKTGSDFEDSEDESSEPAKKNKRKKKIESDESGESSSEGGKKKRRRIKQVDDSEGSGSDTENEGKSKHGRKNIRKVMGKNQLEEATKKAARQEKERLARIAERQKMYNNMAFDESGKPDEVVLDKVILDFDPETKEPLIEVDRGLVKKLKPHQANGIKFMWDACFESVKRIKKDKGSGCILAHCMGLGKTLQVVSLTHTLLIHSELTQVNRVLVVCPLSTVLNWVNEFKMWLKFAHTDFEVDVYELSRHKQNAERAYQLSQWFLHGGVCVLGYEMFRNLSADNVKKFKKKMLRQLQEALVDPGPDLVVCDEGHLLKNEKTSLSQSMNRVKTLRRIVLTGTPLQNNLKEYYCMVQFVKPNLLGKYNEYLNRFVNPITNGQYTDSTEHDIRVMKRRSHVLHKMLDGAVQRRDYGVLAPFLPPKHEYVLFITLNEVQIKLYQHYLDNYSRRPLPGKSSGFLFPDFQSLQRIWTHPLVLKYNSERYEIMQQKKREREEEDSEGSLVDFIDDDSTPDESSSEDESDSLSDLSDDSRKKSKKKKSSKKSKTKEHKGSTRRGTRANPMELEDEPLPDIMEVKNDNPTEWWIPLVTEDEIEDMKNSHKLVLLFEILRQCEAIGDKLLVFSQSLYSLDLIEHFLGRVDEATQEGRVDDKLGGHVGSWSPGIDYFRLDGSTSCENRSIWCKNFNREDNPRARLFLISTRAGGLGINLVAANRVVIFDVSWNPSHDVQSIFRVYRFGQKKPCYVYRFLAMGTMEEKIYERQVTKQAISKRVIDEQQIDRHYKENDLAELYKFEPHPPAPRPVPLVPKDRLFAEMLKDHEALIYKFHEHDSLLENKEEETLSEEERKAAWEDFENEKNRPPPAAFPSWPMHNGMVPNLLAQQQQQLAYAALAQMLRKDMPNITDDSIRSMLPLIYGANPGMFGGYDYGLMQKLSDIYKYTQPGMMNPAMMNPVMNAGGQGGMGGSSGLQYEPPWQRQQQQQQQMRLQQMMQHQNQMGAKFYAGGLGSRDPIAMALQQQRAREIMVGGAAGAGGAAGVGGAAAAGGAVGRPRGRPPLQQPADIVNLDSD